MHDSTCEGSVACVALMPALFASGSGVTIAIDDRYEVWGSGIISIPWDFTVQDLRPQLLRLLGTDSLQPTVSLSSNHNGISMNSCSGARQLLHPVILGSLGQCAGSRQYTLLTKDRLISSDFAHRYMQPAVHSRPNCFSDSHRPFISSSVHRCVQVGCKLKAKQTLRSHHSLRSVSQYSMLYKVTNFM